MLWPSVLVIVPFPRSLSLSLPFHFVQLCSSFAMFALFPMLHCGGDVLVFWRGVPSLRLVVPHSCCIMLVFSFLFCAVFRVSLHMAWVCHGVNWR